MYMIRSFCTHNVTLIRVCACVYVCVVQTSIMHTYTYTYVYITNTCAYKMYNMPTRTNTQSRHVQQEKSASAQEAERQKELELARKQNAAVEEGGLDALHKALPSLLPPPPYFPHARTHAHTDTYRQRLQTRECGVCMYMCM